MKNQTGHDPVEDYTEALQPKIRSTSYSLLLPPRFLDRGMHANLRWNVRDAMLKKLC